MFDPDTPNSGLHEAIMQVLANNIVQGLTYSKSEYNVRQNRIAWIKILK